MEGSRQLLVAGREKLPEVSLARQGLAEAPKTPPFLISLREKKKEKKEGERRSRILCLFVVCLFGSVAIPYLFRVSFYLSGSPALGHTGLPAENFVTVEDTRRQCRGRDCQDWFDMQETD